MLKRILLLIFVFATISGIVCAGELDGSHLAIPLVFGNITDDSYRRDIALASIVVAKDLRDAARFISGTEPVDSEHLAGILRRQNDFRYPISLDDESPYSFTRVTRYYDHPEILSEHILSIRVSVERGAVRSDLRFLISTMTLGTRGALRMAPCTEDEFKLFRTRISLYDRLPHRPRETLNSVNKSFPAEGAVVLRAEGKNIARKIDQIWDSDKSLKALPADSTAYVNPLTESTHAKLKEIVELDDYRINYGMRLFSMAQQYKVLYARLFVNGDYRSIIDLFEKVGRMPSNKSYYRRVAFDKAFLRLYFLARSLDHASIVRVCGRNDPEPIIDYYARLLGLETGTLDRTLGPDLDSISQFTLSVDRDVALFNDIYRETGQYERLIEFSGDRIAIIQHILRIAPWKKEEMKQHIDAFLEQITWAETRRDTMAGLDDIYKTTPPEFRTNPVKWEDIRSALGEKGHELPPAIEGKILFVFSEGAAFKKGLALLLPRLADLGIKIAVVAPDDDEKAKVDCLNVGRRASEKIIIIEKLAEVTSITGIKHRYYYKIEGDPDADPGQFTSFDITNKVKQIIDAIGRASGIMDELKLESLRRAAEKFA